MSSVSKGPDPYFSAVSQQQPKQFRSQSTPFISDKFLFNLKQEKLNSKLNLHEITELEENFKEFGLQEEPYHRVQMGNASVLSQGYQMPISQEPLCFTPDSMFGDYALQHKAEPSKPMFSDFKDLSSIKRFMVLQQRGGQSRYISLNLKCPQSMQTLFNAQ